MPLKPGRKAISRNIKEMAKGPRHAKMARKMGEKKAHEMDVAAAMRKADEMPENRPMMISRPKMTM